MVSILWSLKRVRVDVIGQIIIFYFVQRPLAQLFCRLSVEVEVRLLRWYLSLLSSAGFFQHWSRGACFKFECDRCRVSRFYINKQSKTNKQSFLCYQFAARLPDYFVLKPEKPIVLLKGQDANVTCESEGVSVTKLQWKKETDSRDASVSEGMVTIVKDRSTNRVKAILKITNAQVKDDGVYKCVIRVFEKTGYRSTRIVIENN